MPGQKQKSYSFHIKNSQVFFCMGSYYTLRNKNVITLLHCTNVRASDPELSSPCPLLYHL